MTKSPSIISSSGKRRWTGLGLTGLSLLPLVLAAVPDAATVQDLFFHDSFSYPPGPLAGSNGGLGTNRAYENNPAFDPVIVAPETLTYSSLQSEGNKLRFQPGQTWAVNCTRLINPLGRQMIWGSFLVKINHMTTEAHADGIELTLGATNNIDFGLSISVDGPDLNARINLRDSTAGPVTGQAARLAPGLTHLIVFQYNASSLEQAGLEPGSLALYINPPLGAAPERHTAHVVSSSFLMPEFGSLALFARNCDAELDELRIGATYAAVTPLAQPTSPGTFVEVASLASPPLRGAPPVASSSQTAPSS